MVLECTGPARGEVLIVGIEMDYYFFMLSIFKVTNFQNNFSLKTCIVKYKLFTLWLSLSHNWEVAHTIELAALFTHLSIPRNY